MVIEANSHSQVPTRILKDSAVATILDACNFLDQFAPTRLAEDWDNVGLLVGDSKGIASKIMTCLTVTPDTVSEAIDRGADMIVAHHPLPFRAIKRITTDTIPSKMIWQLIRAGVSIYSPHTGFDSASTGINQMLAERLGVNDAQPLQPIENDPDGLGSGRYGTTDVKTFGNLIDSCKQQFGLTGLHVVGAVENPVQKIAMACGSGGSFLGKAIAKGCDTFVTGETTFHTCLEAESSGVNLLLLGHFSSERFAVEVLAAKLASEFADLEVWASENESDPLVWI